MKHFSAICILAALATAGCLTPRCEQARMKEMTVKGEKYQQVYEATERALARYFEIAYADPAAGIIATRYSQEKGPDEGVVKIRAIAAITDRKQGPAVHLKVIKVRFLEMWDIWGHNIVEREEFIGSDKELEGRILNDIEKVLAGEETQPAAAPPAPVASPAPAPAAGTPAPALSPAASFPPPPPAKK